MKILRKTYDGLKGLISGMALTLGYFVRFDKVITQQYPENKAHLKLPPRSRSRIELVKDEEKGTYTCGACGLCVRACPNNSIEVIRDRDPETKKARLQKFVYHYERCTVCGLCVDSCHTNALKMGRDFESAVYDSSELTIILNKDAIPPAAEAKAEPEGAAAGASPAGSGPSAAADQKPK